MFSILSYSPENKVLVRSTALATLLAFAVLLTACSPIANPSKQVLLLKTEKADIGVDPKTVAVKDGYIHADIHFNYYQPTSRGITKRRLDCLF